MQFWRGKIWVFMALLALCGPVSPLLARVCAMNEWTNGAFWSCVAPTPQAIEIQSCCCEPTTPAPFFGSVAAPLPASQQDFGVVTPDETAPAWEAIRVASFHLETPDFSPLKPVYGPDPPPPLQRFGRTFSCRAPPLV